MEEGHVQNETDIERESEQEEELVSQFSESSALSQGDAQQKETIDIFCTAPDELFGDDPDIDILQQVITQGFVMCGSHGLPGPYCGPCQWSSVVDYTNGKWSHRRTTHRARGFSNGRRSLADAAEDEFFLDSRGRKRRN